MQVRRLSDAVAFRDDKLAKNSLFATARLFCDLYCLRPGQAQRVHTHADSDKLYLGVQGQGMVTLGDESQPLREGELVLAAAGVPHGIRNDETADFICLVTMAPPL